MLLQRFNAVLLHDCLPALDCADCVSYLFVSFFYFFSQTPREYTYRGYNNNNNNNNNKLQAGGRHDMPPPPPS